MIPAYLPGADGQITHAMQSSSAGFF